MRRFTTKPILGRKSNVPQDDPTMLVPVSESMAIAHCVDSMNVEYYTTRNSANKAPGNLQWSNSAVANAKNCLGMFEAEVSGSYEHWVFMGTTDAGGEGRVYNYDASKDPIRMVDDASAPLAFADDDDDKYSIIQYGSNIIWSDNGEHTPYYHAYDGSGNSAKMINSGTEYKPKYLDTFQRRIIMMSDAQTNGDLSIRWSDALTAVPFTSDAANQMYKPGNDSIIGGAKLGNNAYIVYGENSINRMDYYADYTTPFGITTVVDGQGASSHHSIVNLGGLHFFFNRYYGFCAFDGTPRFPAGGAPISDSVEDIIVGIDMTYVKHIVGGFIPTTNEVVWTIPLNGASTPTHLLFYHVVDKTWRLEDKPAWWVDFWRLGSDLTWTQMVALGFTTWDDLT